MSPEAAPAIDVRALSKTFGALKAVDAVSFQVGRGEIFGMLGPNGAGKSTLIRMLTTLIEPTDGAATVAGFDIRHQQNDVRLRIGVIPQAMTSDPDLTCAENLSIQARLYAMPAPERKRVAAQLLESVGLADRANAFAHTLSGGMRRRLEIARGLVHSPQILFLDEPTTGLDPVSRMSVWEMISHLRDTAGLTLFMTTHYMDEADRLCDRIAIVDHGHVVALDTPAALKAQVPGAAVIEVQFDPDIPDAQAALVALPGVKSARPQGPAIYRVASDHGPTTAEAIMDLSRQRQVELRGLSVQSTSLDDVFLFFTGHGLTEHDAPSPAAHPRGRKAG